MENLTDKLLKLKEALRKSMNNSGIGGKGAVKLGSVMPSIKVQSTKPTSVSSSGIKTGITQPSKKSPIKQAEQIQNKDIKDIKMDQAKDLVKFDANGQWSINKSGYDGYSETDNIRRKASNTGETTGIHTMDNVKQYSKQGANSLNNEVKDLKRKSKSQPVKTFTPEEIEAENKKRG